MTFDTETAAYLAGEGKKPKRKLKPKGAVLALKDPAKKVKKVVVQTIPGLVKPECPTCTKCGMFRKAVSPFLSPTYWSTEENEWVLGWPKSDKNDENPKQWVVVFGEIPSMSADKAGDIRKDECFKWAELYAEEYEEIRGRLLFIPSMLCRPNDPAKEEAIPCHAIFKMTRVQSMACGVRHLLPRVHRDYCVDRLVGAGWLGSLVTVNNMGIEHVAGKLYRHQAYNTLCMPIRGVDHIAFDPTSKLRLEQVIENWEWAFTFERREKFDCPWSWYVDGESLSKWVEGLQELPEAKQLLYLDVETNGVDYFKKGFVIGMFSLYYKGAKDVAIVPITMPSSAAIYAKHSGTDDIRGWPTALQGLLKVLFKLVRSKTIKKVGHNLGYDVNAIRSYLKWKMRGVHMDTMYMHYLTDPDNHGMKGLDELIREYAPEIPDYWDELDRYRKDNKIDNFLEVPPDMLAEYAAYDTFVLPKLRSRILHKLKELPGGEFVTSTGPVPSVNLAVYAVFGRIQTMKLCTHLDFMGQRVDTGLAAQVKHLLQRRIDDHRDELSKLPQVIEFETNILGKCASKSSPQYKAAKMGLKPSINWNSLAQQRALMIDFLGLPVLGVTEGGLAKLDEPILQQYAIDYDSLVCKQVMKIRESEKFVTSFLDPMLLDKKLVIRDDGLVHASFRGAQVATSRLSAVRPNITALPRDGSVKHLYVPHHPLGWIVTRDYSGIEVRIMAMLSRCPVLLHLLRTGADVHFNTQSYFFKDRANAKDKNQRSICKQTLFGNLYGQGDKGLFDLLTAGRVMSPVTGLPITLEECHEFNQMLYEAYPGVGEWVKQAHLYGIMNCCIGSGFGFTRFLPALGSWSFSKQVKRVMDYEEIKRHPDYRRLTSFVSKDLRRAQNTPIQSSAGDLTAFAAMRIQETLEDGMQFGLERAGVFSVVHDDIWTFARYTEDVPSIVHVMEDVMDHPSRWIPEILPGIDVSWLDLVPIFGECEIGISPKDAVPAKMNNGVLEIEIDNRDFEDLWPKGSEPIRISGEGEKAVATVDWLDAAPRIRPLLEERRNMKVLSL